MKLNKNEKILYKRKNYLRYVCYACIGYFTRDFNFYCRIALSKIFILIELGIIISMFQIHTMIFFYQFLTYTLIIEIKAKITA